jgi:hypothetical protein
MRDLRNDWRLWTTAERLAALFIALAAVLGAPALAIMASV